MPFASFRQNDDRERVRDASDIVRVVGEHVALRAKGREFVGLCPFHDDHKPSMNVVPTKGIFHCFVCGAGGDVFTFVQKFHKMEFREALEYLAERANIELTPRSPQRSEAGEGPDALPEITRADLVRANAAAAEFFRALLRHPEHGARGREIVARRGISPAMVEAFALGLAPDRWDGLLLFAQKHGLDLRALRAAGLLKERDSGGLYDGFRNRLMFPIHDAAGRVIAFGARKINEEDEPKYLNSPESRLFEKAGTLYGLHQATRAIQTERTAIITEGYTDTIACHQAGIANVVATLGTALTARHATVLRRLCDRVVLLFDGDEAGRRAADRAVEVFFAEEIDVGIATLASVTDAKDPDELLKREGGADLLRRAVAGARDLLAYRYDRIRASLRGAGLSALNRALEEELGRLVELGLDRVNPLRQRLVVKQLAAIAGVPESTVSRAIPAGRRAPRVAEAGEPDEAPEAQRLMARKLTHHEHMLGCLLCEPHLWWSMTEPERELMDPDHFAPAFVRLAGALLAAIDAGEEPRIATVGSWLGDDPDAQALAVALARRVEEDAGGDPDRLSAGFRDSIAKALLEAQKQRARVALSAAPAPTTIADLIEQRRRLEREGRHDPRALGANFGGLT